MNDIVPDYPWKNHHQTVDVTVRRLYNVWNRRADGTKPDDKNERWWEGIARVQDVLRDAENADAPPVQVRALGGGWSLSEAAKTRGYLVATQSLVMSFWNFPASHIEAHFNPKHLGLVQCGCSVEKTQEKAAEYGLCLPTTGASDGQTIVGAISTGTHGSAHTVGAMQDYVRGIHLITASNKHFWIEPTHRVVSDTFLAEYAPGAERISSNEVFKAALVSFGSFGIIHAVLLECEPTYHLEAWQNYYPWKELKPYLTKPTEITTLITSKTGANPDAALLHHVQFVVNPYYAEPDDTVTLLAMYKHPGAPPQSNHTPPTFDSADLYALIGLFADSVTGPIPGALKTAVRLLDGSVKSKYPPMAGETFLHRDFFTGGKLAVSAAGMSIEIGAELHNAEKIMDILLNQAQITEFPGVIGVRYVKQSVATLAFTRFSPTVCFEILSPASGQTQTYYNEILLRLEQENIPFALHWGQMNDYDIDGEAKVRKRWGDEAVDSWLAARARILDTPALRDRFSNQMLENCGLNSLPPAVAPVIAAVGGGG